MIWIIYYTPGLKNRELATAILQQLELAKYITSEIKKQLPNGWRIEQIYNQRPGYNMVGTIVYDEVINNG